MGRRWIRPGLLVFLALTLVGVGWSGSAPASTGRHGCAMTCSTEPASQCEPADEPRVDGADPSSYPSCGCLGGGPCCLVRSPKGQTAAAITQAPAPLSRPAGLTTATDPEKIQRFHGPSVADRRSGGRSLFRLKSSLLI